MIEIKSKLAAAIIVGALFTQAAPTTAAPSVKTAKKYYSISGTSAKELKSQMKKKGPHGYWAYTEWYVKWSAKCTVQLKVTYTYPRLKTKKGMPKSLVKNWQKMMTNLIKHEEGHGKNALAAATEIRNKKCKNGDKIIKKWNRADIKFDAKTKHGKSQGVRLAD